jgi:hypothetical protein
MSQSQENPEMNPPGRRTGRWSHPEIDKLKRLFGLRSEAQIAQELNRSLQSVRRMIGKVFDGPPRLGPWTANEVKELKSYLGVAEVPTIAKILRRSEPEVERKIGELRGAVVQRPWTSEDLQSLKRFYGTRTDADVSLILGRPIERIQAKAKELCLAKDKAFIRRKSKGKGRKVRMPRWTAEEFATLTELYPDHPNLDIARRLDRSVKSVVSKASDLGLHKSPERLKQMGQQNVKARYDRAEQEAPAQAQGSDPPEPPKAEPLERELEA